MSTSAEALSGGSWYRITDDATRGEKRREFVAGQPSTIHLSTGTLEMELHRKHLSEFSRQPAEFIRKVLLDDGRVVNGVRLDLPEETVESLSKSRALGWGIYKAKGVGDKRNAFSLTLEPQVSDVGKIGIVEVQAVECLGWRGLAWVLRGDRDDVIKPFCIQCYAPLARDPE
jgi:hypothetical protein